MRACNVVTSFLAHWCVNRTLFGERIGHPYNHSFPLSLISSSAAYQENWQYRRSIRIIIRLVKNTGVNWLSCHVQSSESCLFAMLALEPLHAVALDLIRTRVVRAPRILLSRSPSRHLRVSPAATVLGGGAQALVVFIITSYSSRETREATQVLQAHQHVVCVVEVAP